MRQISAEEFATFCQRRKLEDLGTSSQEESVRNIIANVREKGDEALLEFTRIFDGVELRPEELRVTDKEIADAYAQVDESVVSALEKAKQRIQAFHLPQRESSWFQTEEDGSMLGQLVRPLDSCGIYVPGGTANYPSSVLMNAIPAKIAGVKSIVMCTPPRRDGGISPYVLVAADMVGVDAIYKLGGAQAVAALAYGTQQVPRVDKIVGPGNIYVTLAKKQVYGSVDIDMLAGPSEILVVADDTANPSLVAADLLSQAEHDTLSGCVLISPSQRLLDAVKEEIATQLARQERMAIAKESLQANGLLVLVADLPQAITLSNLYAPEHLEIMTDAPLSLMGMVKHAGAVFLGHHTPETMGDYVAGSNHVLPTGGTARFASGLGVTSFTKRLSVTMLTAKGLRELGPAALKLAKVEELFAHGEAVRLRMEGMK